MVRDALIDVGEEDLLPGYNMLLGEDDGGTVCVNTLALERVRIGRAAVVEAALQRVEAAALARCIVRVPQAVQEGSCMWQTHHVFHAP